MTTKLLRPLPDVVELNPRRFTVSPADTDLISFVPMKSVEEESGQLASGDLRTWADVKKGYTPFQNGDVIFAKITPCMENGKFALASGLHAGRAAGSTEFHVLRAKRDLDPRYLLHFLFTPNVRRAAKMNMKGAAGQLRVPTQFLEGLSIPVPSIELQREAVAYLDEQLSRLDASVAALLRAQANLKRYRASVLKAACEGRLVPTEAGLARAEGRTFETGAELRQRILAERRARWSGRGKYKEPAPSTVEGLPELPEGWAWATVEQLTYLVTSGSRGWGAFYAKSGVLFIRAQDINTDALNLEGIARVEIPDDAEGTRSGVGSSDILVTITGANVTKSALVPLLSEPAFVSQHVALLKLNLVGTAPFVFNWIVSSANGRKILEAWAYGAGKPGLSLEQVRSLPVALPPLAEQHRIVAEADRRLSLIRGAEAQVGANLARAKRLRQSILQAAFAPPGSVSDG